MTPEARALVRAGREAFRPDAADRARVLQALLPEVGATLAAETASGGSPASAAAKTTVLKILAGLVALGGAGGALVVWLSTAPPPAAPAAAAPAAAPSAAAATAIAASAVAGSTEAAPAVSARPPEAPPATATSITARAAASTPRLPPTDSLAQEVALLSRASAELHSGRPAAALAVLAEHQHTFPRGVLAPERTAARIQALCALGRTSEAQAELARLSPSSPLEARARKACRLPPREPK